MAVQPIRLFGDPVLRTKASVVTDFDDRLRRIVDDLFDTVDHENGAGLAAPQIGVSLRIFVYSCGGSRGYLVNPSWTPVGAEMDESNEGCLSIPGISLPTARYQQVQAKGFDSEGKPVQFTCEGILARAVQHETDHLDGLLFLQRLSPEFRKTAMRDIRSSSWFCSAAISASTVMNDLPSVITER